MYILLQKCNPCLFEIRWDVTCSEVSNKILSQVIPWMSYFIMRLLIKFSENSTYRMCRQINTYRGLLNVKLWQQFEWLCLGNYFNEIPRQVKRIQKGFVRSLCIIQILTGGGEIWDCQDRNDDSRTPAVSHYLVPTRVGNSGS